jgi:class 3 adenylate cyclase
VLEAIADLLDGDADANQPEDVAGFRTIVFTDVVGSTAFVDWVGDEQGRSAMREIEQLVIDTADAHEGDVIKHLGDGSLISFRSNSSALAFGLALQALVEPEPLDIRIGMAAGEPIREGGDIHGAVVAQASRVADIGGPGEIIVADSVRQIAIGKGFNFKPRGEFPLKGFEEHTTVWEVLANRDS